MARRAPSTRRQVVTALHEFTQRELAARLGVSERTIRRWKNEGVEPVNPFVRFALEDEFKAERTRIREYTRRQAVHAEPPEERLGVPLLGTRRRLRRYDERNRWIGAKRYKSGPRKGHLYGGETYLSDIVNYNVTRLEALDVHDMLLDLRDRGATVQFTYRVRAYPEGNLVWRPGTHAGTGYRNLTGYNDADIWEIVSKYVVKGKRHRLVFVGVVEK